MTTNEVQDFMQRIKAHYQEFIIDEFKFNEWYSELKEYQAEDINRKFEEHLKSETYGNYVPKINFLTKNLKKIGETGYDKNAIFVRCNTCNQVMSLSNYDNHIDKCKDIDYMMFLMEKYTDKKADRTKLFDLEENVFKEKFKKMLEYAAQKESNEDEKKRLKEIYELVW